MKINDIALSTEDIYQNERKIKFIFYKKNGKYSVSWTQLVNIALFFMCFSSCGRSSAETLQNETPKTEVAIKIKMNNPKHCSEALYLRNR